MRQRRYLFLPLLVLFAQGVILGQTGTGSLTGTVTDPSGAVVSGVTISAKNTATGLEVSTKSTAAGFLRRDGFDAGVQAVPADWSGHSGGHCGGLGYPSHAGRHHANGYGDRRSAAAPDIVF